MSSYASAAQITREVADRFYDTILVGCRPGVDILENSSQRVRRITIPLARSPVRDAGGNIIDDGFGLGLVKPHPERPSGASELFGGKIGGGLFFAGTPDVTHHTGKITEHLLPVNFVFHFLLTGGQIIGFR